MKKKTRKNIFIALISLGILLVLIPIIGLVQMSVIITSGSGTSPAQIEFTGVHATMFTIGFLLIIAAFVFKYKKFPKLI